MSTEILSPEEFKEKYSLFNSAIFFGGTFDPIHEGHIQDIRKLLDLAVSVFIATTAQNPWKDNSPASLAHRLEMIRLVLQYEKIEYSEDINSSGLILLSNPYTYASDLLAELKMLRQPIFPQEKYYWAIGEDLRESAPKWKDWSERGVPLITLPLLSGISATNVRKGASGAHPAISSFIANLKLYP